MAEMTIKKRPKHLDLIRISFPLAAVISILHRVSGAALFLCAPLLLWMFGASVTSPDHFATFKSVAAWWPVKVILAGLIWSFAHHFCMGIRIVLIDMHIGVEKQASARSSAVVVAVSVPLTLILWGVLL